MEQDPANLSGMSPAAAREYIIGHLATLKLNEKRLAELGASLENWTRRIELARSAGRADLEGAAAAEAGRLEAEHSTLSSETDSLRSDIERMKHQLSGLASSERSVDPDLLEQELLMATGHNPGTGAEVAASRKLEALEKSAGADAALAELKARMTDGEKGTADGE